MRFSNKGLERYKGCDNPIRPKCFRLARKSLDMLSHNSTNKSLNTNNNTTRWDTKCNNYRKKLNLFKIDH